MEDYVKRMEDELNELNIRIGKLGNFIGNGKFFYLTDKKKKLLERQYHVMQIYADLLEERLELEKENG